MDQPVVTIVLALILYCFLCFASFAVGAALDVPPHINFTAVILLPGLSLIAFGMCAILRHCKPPPAAPYYRPFPTTQPQLGQTPATQNPNISTQTSIPDHKHRH